MISDQANAGWARANKRIPLLCLLFAASVHLALPSGWSRQIAPRRVTGTVVDRSGAPRAQGSD